MFPIRLKCVVEYVGTNYKGWQRQTLRSREAQSIKAPKRTVQETIENALNLFAPHCAPVLIVGASRTDAGVHALGQTFHVDLLTRAQEMISNDVDPQNKLLMMETVKNALNYYLRDESVRIKTVEQVFNDWNARQAKSKLYRYLVIDNCKNDQFIALQEKVWQLPYGVNVDKMRMGAKELIGTHDFSAFQSSGCSSPSPITTIISIDIKHSQTLPFPYDIGFPQQPQTIFNNNSDNHQHQQQQQKILKPSLIDIQVKGTGFLYKQVRNMVGALTAFGANRQHHDFKQMLLDKRRVDTVCAPSSGLYLQEIEYD